MKQLLVVGILFLSLICLPHTVFAKMTVNSALNQLDQTVGPTGVSQRSLPEYVGVIIKGALGAVGLVFFCLMVYGGLLWVTSRGNDDQVTKGKDTITAAMIGLAVVISAYAITAFVTDRMINGESAGGSPVQEPIGCCFDKTNHSTAFFMSTRTACQNGGEVAETGEDFVGPEGVGWKFYEDKDEAWCEANSATAF